ncbi:MAG: Gfo/Idh/MocA family oxidoreductase [Saprospiraceae bacterium]|nr:Gfo/Idh/MocA family oxidoreductase [Saprospiraceae bacterium]
MSDKLKVGFIGAGDISLLHAEGIAACEHADLIGLWNITDDLATEKSRLYHCRKYETAAALIADVDAVFVLTALEAHHRYVLMALEAGKHVYVEKPVGATVEEIEDMRELAARKGVICMPGHNYIYEPSVDRAKQLLASGRLGKLVAIYVMYHIQHPEEVAARFPGVVRQIMTHHAYISLYLSDGKPKKVSAMKSVIHYDEIPQEDLAMATIQMEDGAIVHFTASFAADDHAGDPWTMMIKIIGTKGATRYSYRDWVENTPGVVHSQTYSAYPFTILNADLYFIEECILKNKDPRSTMSDAIVAQQIVEAIESSIETDRHIYL